LAFLLLPSSQLDVSLAQNNDFNSLSLLSYGICVANCVYVEVIITENKREGEKETQQEHVCSMDKTEPEFMNHRKVCRGFDCSLRLNAFLLLPASDERWEY